MLVIGPPALCAGLYQSMAMMILVLGFIIRSGNRIKDFASKLHRTFTVCVKPHKVFALAQKLSFSHPNQSTTHQNILLHENFFVSKRTMDGFHVL
jgi:hypothetical protein